MLRRFAVGALIAFVILSWAGVTAVRRYCEVEK